MWRCSRLERAAILIVFDAGKTRVIGVPYSEKNCGDMLSRFHLIPERIGQTDRQSDGQILLYQYRASV